MHSLYRPETTGLLHSELLLHRFALQSQNLFFFFCKKSFKSRALRAKNFLHAFRFGLGYSSLKYLFSFCCGPLSQILSSTWLSKPHSASALLYFYTSGTEGPQILKESAQPLKKPVLWDLQIVQPRFLEVPEGFLGGPRQQEFRLKHLPDLDISKSFLFMDSLMPNTGFMRSFPLMRC